MIDYYYKCDECGLDCINDHLANVKGEILHFCSSTCFDNYVNAIIKEEGEIDE